MNKVERFEIDHQKARLARGQAAAAHRHRSGDAGHRRGSRGDRDAAGTQRAPQGGRFQRQADQPVPTWPPAARTADVPVYLDGVGTMKALNTVTVSSQVDGKLINIFFKEGQDVEQGFVLAQIDPTDLSGAI